MSLVSLTERTETEVSADRALFIPTNEIAKSKEI